MGRHSDSGLNEIRHQAAYLPASHLMELLQKEDKPVDPFVATILQRDLNGPSSPELRVLCIPLWRLLVMA